MSRQVMSLSKEKSYTEGRARYKHQKYYCRRGERHSRTYNYYQYQNYVRHCETWECERTMTEKPMERRTKVISFSNGGGVKKKRG
jgi:hypothetical protein